MVLGSTLWGFFPLKHLFFPIRNSPCSHQSRLLLDCRKLRTPEVSFLFEWFMPLLVQTCMTLLKFVWAFYRSDCNSFHVPKAVAIILFEWTLSTLVQVYSCSEITLLRSLEVLFPSWENLLGEGLSGVLTKGLMTTSLIYSLPCGHFLFWESCASWRAWKCETVLFFNLVSLDWKFCSHTE